jgi:hydroxymethylpyrimidine pyrophosphatase-like HAD family hydrolase
MQARTTTRPLTEHTHAHTHTDVDGTLTAPRKVVTPEMKQFIADLRTRVTVGVVGGSDLSKVRVVYNEAERVKRGCV